MTEQKVGGERITERPPSELMTPSQVAALFGVGPKTVTRWARSGRLTALRTLGGHRRFSRAEVMKKIEELDK